MATVWATGVMVPVISGRGLGVRAASGKKQSVKGGKQQLCPSSPAKEGRLLRFQLNPLLLTIGPILRFCGPSGCSNLLDRHGTNYKNGERGMG
ncbi:hypothetical protein R1flu_026433 [Riccia fluitans]|uniref:Uncharacterized protein n=1 Tax=Riccia fluitans TaxID=41844 RepID=A0ABD1XFZ2_9MARC